MKLEDRTFAYYKDGYYMCEGTIPELMEITGYTSETLRWMASPNKKVRSRHTVLVDVIDLDTFLCSLAVNKKIIEKLHAVKIYTAEDLLKHKPEYFKELFTNETQFKSIMTYYKYFKEGLEEDESNHNQTAVGDVNRAG